MKKEEREHILKLLDKHDKDLCTFRNRCIIERDRYERLIEQSDLLLESCDQLVKMIMEIDIE